MKRYIIRALLFGAFFLLFVHARGEAQEAEEAQETQEAQDKGKLYGGGALFWSPRVYSGDSLSNYTINGGLGLLVEYYLPQHLPRPANFLAVETGLEFAPDWVVITNAEGDNYLYWVMNIPLVVKFVLQSSESNFMFEPYAGIHFNIPLAKNTHPFPASFRIGSHVGAKIGPGVLFLDPQFSMDFGDSSVTDLSGTQRVYRRYMFYLGVGYKYDFFQLISR